MSQDDQAWRITDAEALLRRPSWNDEEIDHAVALHDHLESPAARPDPVVVQLRRQLAGPLRQRSERSGHHIDLIRAEIFSAGRLDSPNAFKRRLWTLEYLGLASYLEFQTGAMGTLDRAVSVLLELDRAVAAGGAAARAVLGPAGGSPAHPQQEARRRYRHRVAHRDPLGIGVPAAL